MPSSPLSRRQLLAHGSRAGLVAGMGALGLSPRRAHALAGGDLKFLFVVNYGGWDPTRVFATEFHHPFVDMERDAELARIGDLLVVDHESRPAVRSFFEAHGSRTLILNGVLVSSIAHENCLRIQMTGSTAQDRSDWGAILAGSRAAAYSLPQVVVGGPSFPGEFGSFVTRTGSNAQLERLISGEIIEGSDLATGRPDARAEDIMDAWLRRRAAAAAAAAEVGSEAAGREAWLRGLERAGELKGLEHEVAWSGAGSFAGQAELAVDLLGLGVSRVATLQFSYYSWDTHTQNDTYQSLNFEQLFQQLARIQERLATWPGSGGGTLADETVMVVLSEMGRTPQLNAAEGKDHWPYTSVMMVGPNLAGDRVIGGYDASYYGQTVDLSTGDMVEDATNLSSEVVGATLLALADIDPGDYTSGVEPLTAALA